MGQTPHSAYPLLRLIARCAGHLSGFPGRGLLFLSELAAVGDDIKPGMQEA